MPAYANKINNQELSKKLEDGKVDPCQMTVSLLKDLEAIRKTPEDQFSNETAMRARTLLQMFASITAFIARTADLSDPPQVVGAKDSPTHSKKRMGDFKLPPPPDLRD
jgi:hypothetical protein